MIQIKDYVLGQENPIICVPVVETQTKTILEQIKKLGRQKVQAIEWRMDYYERAEDTTQVAALLEQIKPYVQHTILLATFRSKKEGGTKEISPDAYETLLYTAAKSGCVDLVDVEVFQTKNCIALVQGLKKAGVFVVGSCHNFRETPPTEKMTEILEQMREAGVDIPKLAVMPNCTADTARLLEATAILKERYPEELFITMSMGEIGIPSRIMGGFFGSCLTFASAGQASAPGQIELEKMTELLLQLGELKKLDYNLYFVGFMGSGKTSVSKKLCQSIRAQWIDTDEEIEKEEQRAITKIFSEDGEAYFRKAETSMLKKIASQKGQIVSCGGGIVLKEENIQIMKESGKVIFLSATPKTIFEHVRYSKKRPVLNGHMNVEYIAELLGKRQAFYEKAKDIEIVTDGKNLEEIVKEIKKLIFS